MRAFIEKIIDQALSESECKQIPIYTFALYFDHESLALSACIDTEENSKATVARINTYNRKYFFQAVASGDLKGASLWLANAGRSLSLGDFHMVNMAREELPAGVSPNQEFFVSVVQTLVISERKIAAQAESPQSLLLCSSGMSGEVEYWWSVA